MEVWGGNLPTERDFEMPGIDVQISSKPDGESKAGGDVYYLSACASGRITRALLADVSGHGDGAAEVATGLRDLMRGHVNVIRQDQLVAEMNRQFSAANQDTSFATALVLTYFLPKRTLTISNAGHPPPFHYVAKLGTWRVVAPAETEVHEIGGTPLGVYDNASYPSVQLRIAPGDMVFCYSDALIELRLDQDQYLGIEGLLGHLNRLTGESPNDLVPRLVDQLSEISQDGLFDDDRTMMLLRANQKRVSFLQSAIAPFRLLRPVKLSAPA